jgi:hypothetical protein
LRQRKRSPDPAAAGFSLAFRGLCWEGLSTGPYARRRGSGLSGPIFSGPHDCTDLVKSL